MLMRIHKILKTKRKSVFYYLAISENPNLGIEAGGLLATRVLLVYRRYLVGQLR